MVQTIKETKRIASPSIEVRDAQSLTSRTADFILHKNSYRWRAVRGEVCAGVVV
jgi:hypothetical protein